MRIKAEEREVGGGDQEEKRIKKEKGRQEDKKRGMFFMWRPRKEGLRAGGRVEALAKSGKQGDEQRNVNESQRKWWWIINVWERWRRCTYACDKACSLHSLMSLMRLLYLEETKQSSDSLSLLGSKVASRHRFLLLLLKFQRATTGFLLVCVATALHPLTPNVFLSGGVSTSSCQYCKMAPQPS